MKCPYCSTEDASMFEFLNPLTYVSPIVYKFLCNCCGKTFVTEEKPNELSAL